MKDVIIIGKGPAGISASLYTARAGLSTAIISTDTSALTKAELIQNFYGAGTISGKDLLVRGIEQATQVGVEMIDEEVLDLAYGDSYIVTTDKHVYFAKSVIIATGSARKSLPIEGLKTLEGRGVSYCAVCDSFFYRKKSVAVLGNSSYALHEYNVIKDVAASAVILTNGLDCDQDFGDATVYTKKIKQLVDNSKLEKVVFEDDTTLDIDGLFVALGQASADVLARKIGAVSENGFVVVDENKSTNLPGLFAAGDCTGGLAQISKAVYDGTIAGTAAIKFVKSLGK